MWTAMGSWSAEGTAHSQGWRQVARKKRTWAKFGVEWPNALLAQAKSRSKAASNQAYEVCSRCPSWACVYRRAPLCRRCGSPWLSRVCGAAHGAHAPAAAAPEVAAEGAAPAAPIGHGLHERAAPQQPRAPTLQTQATGHAHVDPHSQVPSVQLQGSEHVHADLQRLAAHYGFGEEWVHQSLLSAQLSAEK